MKLQFELIAKRIKDQGIVIKASEETLDKLTHLGFDPQYGGRPVNRILQQQILNPLSKGILGDTLDKSQEITVDFFDEDFVFRKSEITS